MGIIEKLQKIVDEAPGKFGVAIKHVEKGEGLHINSEAKFELASVVKIPILVALYKEVAAGNIRIDERVQFEHHDMVPGSGVIKDLDLGLAMTIKDLATLMIIISDNTATDKLLSILGKEKVNEHMLALGFENLCVHETIWELLALRVAVDPEPFSQQKFDEITELLTIGVDESLVPSEDFASNNIARAQDLNLLLEKIVLSDGMEEETSKQILEILSRQQSTRRLPNKLPRGTKTANKTGTIAGSINDSGIIYLPDNKGTVLISVLSCGNPTVEAGEEVISTLASAVYDYFVEK
ncbi:serine hydrolase [Evansella sp. AB-rgal1]|uniref:serine hydrolase n=1 Tax=Evansella sp. AB-rgal1 TaxID=3242696 RepID=UPI00359E90C5